MKQAISIALSSLVIGVVITAFGFIAAFVTAGSNLKYIFYWQGYLFQHLIPAHNLGIAENPILEATPIHVVVFFLGIPVGVVVYSLLSFAVLSILGKKN